MTYRTHKVLYEVIIYCTFDIERVGRGPRGLFVLLPSVNLPSGYLQLRVANVQIPFATISNFYRVAKRQIENSSNFYN